MAMTFVTNLIKSDLNSLLPPAFAVLPVKLGHYSTDLNGKEAERVTHLASYYACLVHFSGQLPVQHILDFPEQALVLGVGGGIAESAGKLLQQPLLLFVKAGGDLHLHHHHHVAAT